MVRRAWWVSTLFAIAFALVSITNVSPARAMQLTPQQKQEIKLHYERATRAYDLQKYGEAIEEYQKAYEIGGDPPMLYNIAQSYRLNDQPAEAIRYYRRYLQRAPEARNRDYVERKIADLEKLIEERRKAAAAATPPPITVTPPVVTPPVTPTVVPPPPVNPPVVTPPPPPPEPSRAGLVVGWAMIGAGVIADGIAIYEGLQAKKKGDELTRMSRMSMPVPFDPGIESAGKTANIAAIVLGIGGTALAITGAIVLITSTSSDAPESAPRAARVRLTPWLGPGVVGGGASLRF